MGKHFLLVGLLGGSLLSGTVAAADFDGGKPLLCATQVVSECVDGRRCRMVLPREVNLPNFFTVDVSSKLLTGKHDDGLDAETPVERIEHLDGKLVLQGADDGLPDVRDGMAWSLSIDEDSGRGVLTASGDDFAIVAFTSCLVK